VNFIKKSIIILPLITFIFFGYNKWVFSWGLFDLFTDNKYSSEGLKKVQEFNPEKDILYLPDLSDKKLFYAVNDLSICRKQEVRKYIYLYLTVGREYVIRAIERSEIYLDIIYGIFEENRDIPKEIALLPLLESGFDPMAVSRSNAVGLWQFLKSTSQHFDLRGDKWVEERRDIEKSTTAAIRHLRHLHSMFNSWDLALAAYNGGGGQVRRAMQKTGAKNIWQLQEAGVLSQETSQYVPRYLALLIIYKNQKLFGIEDEIKNLNTEKTDTVTLKYSVNINDVSRVCNVDRETIKKYNPEIKMSITPPTVKDFRLRLPEEAKEKFEKNKNLLYKNGIRSVKRYRVKRGDSISKIAAKSRTSISVIARLNEIQKPYYIKIGQIIYIPI